MKIKASETTLVQLDYLVGRILQKHLRLSGFQNVLAQDGWYSEARDRPVWVCWNPSTDWAQGGPLIDKYQIMFETAGEAGVLAYFKDQGTAGPTVTGPTHLIAAMRLIVVVNYSEVVEIPEELA